MYKFIFIGVTFLSHQGNDIKNFQSICNLNHNIKTEIFGIPVPINITNIVSLT